MTSATAATSGWSSGHAAPSWKRRVPFIVRISGRQRITKTRKTKTRKRWGQAVGHDFEALSGRILEAAVEVHKALGPGFLESVYQKAMEVALRHRTIAHEQQKEIRIVFENEEVGLHRLDLVVGNEIIVELKAVKALEDIHHAQVKSYLK